MQESAKSLAYRQVLGQIPVSPHLLDINKSILLKNIEVHGHIHIYIHTHMSHINMCVYMYDGV